MTEALRNTWVFHPVSSGGVGGGGVTCLCPGIDCGHGHLTQLPPQPTWMSGRNKSIWAFATKVWHRRKFAGRLVQSLRWSEEGPERQGNLLNVTQPSGGWPKLGNQSPRPCGVSAGITLAIIGGQVDCCLPPVTQRWH